MKQPGIFEVRDKDLAARIARLYTPRGYIETPSLLPVIDPMRQELPLKEIQEAGFNAVITNAYLLWKRLGGRRPGKTIHEILEFNGIVMTDSGAYQLLEYGQVEVDNETIIDFEKSINSDIAVILDVPTGNAEDYNQAQYSVEETLRRAVSSLKLIDPEKRVWTLPLQGGRFLSLLERSTQQSTRLLGPDKYQLVALGSPTVLLEKYDYATLLDMVFTVRRILPWNIPLHLFGAGHPMIIPFAVALGVDMFDSASYILYARDNRLMTRSRTYRLEDLDYMPCSTPICLKYTPHELLEMPKKERVKLLAMHNLYVLREAISEVKQAIREGRLWELLEEKSRSHPSLARAFSRFARMYTSYITQHTPRVKASGVRGLLLYSLESTNHPRILQHNEMLLRRYKPRKTGEAVLIPVGLEKPFTHSKEYQAVRKLHPHSHIIGYALYIGVIPEELAETYPLSQYEQNTSVCTDVVLVTVERVIAYLLAHRYQSVKMYYSKGSWSESVARETARRAEEKGIPIRLSTL